MDVARRHRDPSRHDDKFFFSNTCVLTMSCAKTRNGLTPSTAAAVMSFLIDGAWAQIDTVASAVGANERFESALEMTSSAM